MKPLRFCQLILAGVLITATIACGRAQQPIEPGLLGISDDAAATLACHNDGINKPGTLGSSVYDDSTVDVYCGGSVTKRTFETDAVATDIQRAGSLSEYLTAWCNQLPARKADGGDNYLQFSPPAGAVSTSDFVTAICLRGAHKATQRVYY